mmetsp:Transcript_12694/g.19132  ORF Transcript_12694/g.19132 Transcript_12694/m.19132 type:complete len:236 (-) Transcript_12694:188-895(-)|eukprot:CAMPEP_0196822890 /NCGR_PEP_ID=MMETSP1362-20130617/85187_1 /TAXON_ID=163516 /ORGANISM="Leptocylindrus danicus, Strain CCMP1856" /LENGTH=235 /DNA_ID=CAMNT_0042202573 /DNA_START=177 /DNA_END=884 /DNA_ORIENTATION=-
MSSTLRWGDVSDSDDEDISAFKEMNKPKPIVHQEDRNSRAPTKVLQRPKAKPALSVNRTVDVKRNEKTSNSLNRNYGGRDDKGNNYTHNNDRGSRRNHSNWKQEAMKSRTISSSRSRENMAAGNNWMQQRRKKQEENEREEMMQRQELERNEAEKKEEKRKAQMEAMKAAVHVLKSERNVSDAPQKQRKPKMRPKKETFTVKEVVPTRWERQKNGGVLLTKGEVIRKIVLTSPPV